MEDLTLTLEECQALWAADKEASALALVHQVMVLEVLPSWIVTSEAREWEC